MALMWACQSSTGWNSPMSCRGVSSCAVRAGMMLITLRDSIEGPATNARKRNYASGCGWSAEDVVQLALQAQPIRPAPQVIEIETRGLPVDNAPGIDKIMIPAGFELQQDQVFGGRHPDRQSFDGQ